MSETVAVDLVWGVGRGLGGSEKRMCEVIAELATRGISVRSYMLGPAPLGALGEALQLAGSQVGLHRTSARLLMALRGSRSDLVITMGLRASLITRAARAVALRRNPPLVLDARNGLEAGRSPIMWAADRWTQRLVGHYLANSDAVGTLLKTRGISAAKVRVLYSVVPDTWYQPARVGRRPGSVVMVGNDRPEKRQALGLSAFIEAGNGHTLEVFTNIDRDLSRTWRKLASEGSGSFYCHTGRAVTPDELDRFAILLHPSSHESAPRAVIEARARGCFVVAFDVGDTRRLLGAHGGTLVPPDDVGGLTAALRDAIAASLSGELPQVRSEPEHSVARYTTELLALRDTTRRSTRTSGTTGIRSA